MNSQPNKRPSESGSEWVVVDENGNEIPDPGTDPDASASGSQFMRPNEDV